MPLLVNSVPNLAQGVSQQPDNLRYPGQCDEQINAWATVVEGLVKRPPTTYTKKIGDSDPGANLFTHFVKRDEDNKYCVTVSLGGVGVINLEDGTNYPVSISTVANNYLSLGTSVTNPLADLRALTVADYTFLVNKRKTVQKSTLKTSNLEKEALIIVKLGDYEKFYSVYIDGLIIPYDSGPFSGHTGDHDPGSHVATYKSGPSSGSGSDGTMADTTHIAEDLAALITYRYGAVTTGISAINVSAGGSGYVIPPHRLDPIVDYDLYKVEVEVIQKDSLGVVQGKGARGICDISGGQIQSVTVTNSGSGYDSSYLTPEVIVRELAWSDELDKWEEVVSGSGATFTATISQFDPIKVERKGSVIKLSRISYVENDDKYYKCIQNHTSSSTNEPGAGADWEDYWEVAEETDLASDWASASSYTVGTDFSVRTEDGLSDEALTAAYKEVASITDLPKKCYNNFRIKIRGDADIDQDDYYVIFKTKDNESFGEGSWVETVGWFQDKSKSGEVVGIEYKVEPTTMPITLVPVISLGNIVSFKLQTPEEDKEINTNEEKGWRKRNAGDDDTSPFPSFVGGTINDVFFFKNRLGFLTDSNVIFSEADEYFNFFRTTTQQLLDSAPIDVGLSHTKVAVLQHAVPFQEKLMLFSKQSQFVLRGADILSPKTVAISPVTEYDISDSVQPVALGNYIYFTFRRNDFEGMYEYYIDNNTETFHSEEITSQIPKYITKQVEKIAGSQAENTIVVGTSEDRNTLFVYKYFWSNKEKIQSAWMKFTFGREVRGFDFIDSNLHLFTKDDDGLHLEKLTLEDGIKDAGLDYTLYLDSKIDGSELTTSYDAADKTTTISGFEYDPVDVVIYTKTGNKVTFTKTTSTAGTVGGDLTSIDFVAGIPYNMLYRFSDQTLKQPTERGGRSASDYAFQTIRNGSLNYAETGHFTVEVTPKFRDKYTYAFNPDIVGANLTLNAFTPQDGHFRFPVQCQPNEAKIEVVTDSALPVKLLAAEFESMMIPRSRRYGA